MCFTVVVFTIFYFHIFLQVIPHFFIFFYGLQELFIWAYLSPFDLSGGGSASLFTPPHNGFGGPALYSISNVILLCSLWTYQDT